MSLQTTMKTYTVKEKAKVIYNTVVDVFNWNRTSDCVTPLDLVRKQFEGVSPQGKICIPGAGIGTYVLIALEKGFSPENITAVELDPMYYELGSGMFNRLGVNYVHADFLTWEPNMKFDVVIGNPPYQGGNFGKAVYKSLWPLFWAKSFLLVKPGGVISLITPLTWCAPTADLSKKDAIDGETRLWKVFEKYSTLADVTTVKNFFPGVGSSFSAVTVDTSGDSGLTFTNGFSSNLGFYPLSGAEEVQEQLSLTNNISTNLKVSGRITPGIRVSLLNTRKINEQNVEICQSMEFPKTNAEPTLYSHIYCKDEEEAEYVRSRILDCADILYKHCRYHGFLNMNVLGMISLNLSQC